MTRIGSALLCAWLVIGWATTIAWAQEKRVLFVLWRGETPAEAAFRERLKNRGVKIEIDVLDAGQDRRHLAEAVRGAVGDLANHKYAVIYTYGTVVTQVVKSIVPEDIPIVFDIVYDAVGAELVASLERPGGSVTGATNGVRIAEQFEVFKTLAKFKSLAFFFDPRAQNNNIILEELEEWCDHNGVTLTPRRIVPGESLGDALEEIRSGRLAVDAVYSGQDSYLATLAPQIHEAIGNKVLLFGGTEIFVAAGWLAAYSPQFDDLGAAAADQVIRILAGASPATLPVIRPTPRLVMSGTASAVLGVMVPPGALLSN